LKRISCPLCGKSDERPLCRLRDIYGDPRRRFRLVRCRRCGLAYLNPQPEPDELQAAYSEAYYDAEVFHRGQGLETVRAVEADRLSRLEGFARRGRILDVGCGCGRFLARAGERGWEPYGVEMDGGCTAHAKAHYGISEIHPTLSSVGLPAGSFQAVTFWDSLEHFPDPLGVLREAVPLLTRGGVLAVTTPNIDSLQARLLGSFWCYRDAPRHLVLFSPGTLRAMMRAAGLRCLEMASHCRFAEGGGLFVSALGILHRLGLDCGGACACDRPAFLVRAVRRLLYGFSETLGPVFASAENGIILESYWAVGEEPDIAEG
jgi:SAM-dependent methyltransferase